VHHHGSDRVVVVEADLVPMDLADRARLRGQHEWKLVEHEPGLDAGDIERGAAGLRRVGELLAPFRVECRRIEEARRAGRHDIDAGLEEAQVVGYRACVALRPTRRVHDAIGMQIDERIGVVGHRDADRLAVGELSGIATHLLRRVDPHTDELEIRSAVDRPDGDRADPPRRPDCDAKRFGAHLPSLRSNPTAERIFGSTWKREGSDRVSTDSERKAEILDAAAALFASSGLRTSLQQIADACGILAGSLYHHFESKEAIFIALVERYQAELDEIAEKALEQGANPHPPDERIVALGTAIAGCAVRHRAALLLTLYEPPAGASAEMVRLVSRTPAAINAAMLTALKAARSSGHLRREVDLERLAD